MAVKEQSPKKSVMTGDKKMKGDKLNKNSKPGMKAGPPKKKAQQKADQVVRMAIASGDVMKDEVARKTEQDARTLYIRFPGTQPKTADEIKELHSDIKFVRTPRVGNGKAKGSINYAFLEFGNTEECKAAKNKLATTQFKENEVYVDFVGANSKAKKKTAKTTAQLNPTRLFVCGLADGVNKTNLQEMFPKAGSACIPQKSKKKGTSYGFVQFSTPADAKAAFDAAQDLTIANHKITVLFAKMTETKPQVLKKKAEKRKAKTEEKKLKKVKTDDTVEKKENEDEDDEDEDDEEVLDDTIKEKTEDEDEDDDEEEEEESEAKVEKTEDDDDDDEDDEESEEVKEGEDDDDEDDDDDDDDDEDE